MAFIQRCHVIQFHHSHNRYHIITNKPVHIILNNNYNYNAFDLDFEIKYFHLLIFKIENLSGWLNLAHKICNQLNLVSVKAAQLDFICWHHSKYYILLCTHHISIYYTTYIVLDPFSFINDKWAVDTRCCDAFYKICI